MISLIFNLIFAIISLDISYILVSIADALVGGLFLFVLYGLYKNCARTLMFTSDGCVAEIMGIREYYKWSEIMVRRVDVVEGSFERMNTVGICLSTNPKDKDSIKGFKYKSFFPRLKGFCVYLKFEHNYLDTVASGRRPHYYYDVDGQEFLSTIREWKVEYDLA